MYIFSSPYLFPPMVTETRMLQVDPCGVCLFLYFRKRAELENKLCRGSLSYRPLFSLLWETRKKLEVTQHVHTALYF